MPSSAPPASWAATSLHPTPAPARPAPPASRPRSLASRLARTATRDPIQAPQASRTAVSVGCGACGLLRRCLALSRADNADVGAVGADGLCRCQCLCAALCPAGKRGAYGQLGGGSFCVNCTLGRFSHLDGLSSCKECANGEFAPAQGLSACSLCPLGTFASSVIAHSHGLWLARLLIVLVTTFPQVGSSSCRKCAVGSDASLLGRPSCTPCDVRMLMET